MEIFELHFNAILIVSSIVAIIGLLLLIVSLVLFLTKSTKDTYFTSGIIIILVAGIFGFGVIAGLVPISTATEEVNDYEVAFTTSTVTLVINDYAEIFYDAKTYNILKNRENAIVYYAVKLNSYNRSVETPILTIDKRYE